MADMDLDGILKMFRAGPTDEEKAQAKKYALMRAGLGVLAANQPGPTPRSSLGVLAQGGMGGLDAYQSQLQYQMNERRAGGANALQALQIKRALEQQKALQGLLTPESNQAPAERPAGLAPSTAEAIGAPWAAAPAVAPPTAPGGQGGYQPIPLGRLASAAAAGVNVDPFLKMNAAAQPDVLTVDAGNENILIDKKTLKVLNRMPKGAAPGSVPFEASDIKPEGYRDFLLNRSRAGANNVINNVNAFTPASEAAQTEFMKGMRTSYDQLKTAGTVLDNIEKAKALIPSARGFMGPGGETMLEAAKFLNNRLGMKIDTAGVKDAEELRSRVFFQIMENLKKMDAQPSQQQQIMMRDALGKLGTDPNALGSVLDAYGDIVRGKVDQHNIEARGAVERGVKFPYDPVINLPKPSSATPAAPSNRIRYDARGNRIP